MSRDAVLRKLDAIAAGEWDQHLALPAEPAGVGLREALERAKQHRECGQPTYDGCFSHFTGPHCRADGLPWPCDVESIRAALAATPVGGGGAMTAAGPTA